VRKYDGPVPDPLTRERWEMNMPGLVRAATLLAGLLWLGTAQAAILRYSVVLDQLQEVPTPSVTVPLAFGHGTLFYDDASGDLDWFVGYGYLSGAPTAAHLHVAPPGIAGPVVFSLGSFLPLILDGTFGGYMGDAFLPPHLEPALFAEHLYVNIHTLANPSGEIRGQVLFHSVVVPVPAAGLLLASACAALLVPVRRRSRALRRTT
jgi:hypothetical protein